MAAVMSVTVGGVDLTSKILMETFTAEVGSRDTITTCSFDLRDETKTVDIKSGSLVIVTSTVTISPSAPVATVIWRGYVGNIDWAFDGAANLVTVDCQSANSLLDQKAYRNKEAYRTANGRTRGSDIIWLLSDSTASEGASPIIYNAAKIRNAADVWSTDIYFGGKTLREALEHFCKNAYSAKMQFWVDTSGELNIARVGTTINMIANWEFQLPVGTATTATSWTYVGTPTREAIAGQNSNGAGDPISGSEVDRGLKVDNSTEAAWQEISGITAGRRYYFSGAIKNLSANRAQILLRFRASSGGAYLSPTFTVSTATVGSWVRVEQVVTAPATATHLEIRLAYSGTTSGSVYYDNLQLIAETASFGISDTPNDSTTFAPMNYEESLDASAIINAVAIKGGETKKGSKKYTTYYREFAPSLAYFGRVYGSFIDDSSVTSNGAADRAADAIFSESAMPVREGSYTISSDRLGYTVPVAGTYQIFELSRMPAARQITINRIEGLSILPFGNGEIVYEIQFGSQKGNLASALATVGSALIGTAKPRLGSTAFEHNLQQSGYVASGRLLSDPQVTGVAAEVEAPSSMPAANTPMSIIKKNTSLLPLDNLPDITIYADEFPEGTLVMLQPDPADPHLTKPTLYRSDGVSSWAVSTAATLQADAADIGQFQHGILTADAIFAGTIDANSIDVINLNADNITTGTISAVDVLASRITNDPAGVGLLIQGDGAGVDAGFGGVNDAVIYSGYNATSVDNAIENASNFIYLSPDSITLPDETVGAGVVISGADGVVIVGENTMIGTESNVGNLGGNYVHIRRDFDSEGIDLATEGGVSINTWNDNNAYATLTVSANGIGTQQARAIEASGTSEFEIIRATSTTDASLSSTGHAFQIGASSGQNLRIDSNEIMVVNNGGTTGMFLQSDGGTLQVGGNTTIIGTLTATNLVSNNDVTLTGTVINQRASATADVWLSSQTGDSVNRFLIEANGGMFWGSGSATRDTNLYRGAANLLETDDNFQVGSQLRVVAPTGTTQTSSQAIYFFVSGNGSYELRRNTSSARYKTNIVDADEVVLEAARKVKPRHYESTIEAEAGATRLGFIAEEIHEAGLTHAVGYDSDGKPETIDPVALIAALWHRVNDLEDRLKELEK
jgi:hypothetical protein